MGQVDDPHDAEQQGQPAGHQKQQKTVLNGIEELHQIEGEFHFQPV